MILGLLLPLASVRLVRISPAAELEEELRPFLGKTAEPSYFLDFKDVLCVKSRELLLQSKQIISRQCMTFTPLRTPSTWHFWGLDLKFCSHNDWTEWASKSWPGYSRTHGEQLYLYWLPTRHSSAVLSGLFPPLEIKP